MWRVCEAGDAVDSVDLYITVIPEPGMKKVVGQALLAVAAYPNQVQVVSSPQFGYRVPADVFMAFEALGELGVPSPPEPHLFVDGDTDLTALKKREKVRKSRKAAAEKAEEAENNG